VATAPALGQHFEGKAPAVQAIYRAVLRAARAAGPVTEDPKKTSIHLVRRTALAGVATRKDSLILTLKGDHALHSPRLFKTERVSASRYHHEFKLSAVADVDEELQGWIREAYVLSE
jgi:hypothetical protein